MSKLRIALALVIVAAAAAMGYRAYQRSLLSPFAIGTVRPGMRFRDADEDARRELKHGYTCRTVGGDVQICKLLTKPAGVLKQVVDGSGRVALIQFRITDTAFKLQQFGHAQGSDWNHVHAGDTEPSDTSDTNWETWQTADSLWTAEMSWRRHYDLPGLMTVTDERRLRRIAESNPAAFFALVDDTLLDRRDLARAPARPAVVAEAPQMSAEDLDAAANAAASSAASLPVCAPVRTPLASATDTTIQSMQPDLFAVAEQVVERAFPGTHLETVGRGISLVDASGGAEPILLYPNASTAAGDVYVFAVGFPQRMKEAASRAAHFDAANQCRATSEVLVARVDPATHSVLGLQRIGVDDESLANGIGHVDFAPTADPPQRVIVEYLASYGTADWYGQVRWNELIAVDSVRIMRRAPMSYGKKLPDGRTDGGPLVPEDRGTDDLSGLSYEPGAFLHYSTLSTDPRAPARHITLSTWAGLPNGWVLLLQL